MSDPRQSFDFDEMGYSRKEAPMTDKLRETAQAVLTAWRKSAPMMTADYHGDACDCLRCQMGWLEAALAAAPQPACCLCDDRPQAPNNPCGACGKAAPQPAPETMAWAVVDPVAGIRATFPTLLGASRDSQEGDSIERVAIRVVEGCDDAA